MVNQQVDQMQTPESTPTPQQPKVKLSWGGVAIGLVVCWIVFANGWDVLNSLRKAPVPVQIIQTATAGPGSLAVATPAPNRSGVGDVVVVRSNAPANALPARTVVVSAAPAATALPIKANAVTDGQVVATTAPTSALPECILTTWIDGSQGCNDGRPISAEQSQPGYCKPFYSDVDKRYVCSSGKPAGRVILPEEDPITPEPTWQPAPAPGVQFTVADGPNNNTCVTVGQQTACSDPNVKLDQDDAAFVAQMIIDGRIKQGVGAPKG